MTSKPQRRIFNIKKKILIRLYISYFQVKTTVICPYIVDTGLCKNPKIRFPSLMKIVTPQEAADNIVDAVRRNYLEITIPSSLYYVNLVSSLNITFIMVTLETSTLEVRPSSSSVSNIIYC